MQKIKNGSFLITGGTGSFAKALCERLVLMNISEVTIYSRDARAQRLMSLKYPLFKYVSGDINDSEKLMEAMQNIDYVVHAAALKDVVMCEKDPALAARINITGSESVFECAIRSGVKRVVAVSSDKAVNPSGVMGMTKAIMERMVRAKAMESAGTIFTLVRFGNLTGSSGTVIPLFLKQASEGKKLTVTDPDMTRFLMTPSEAAEYLLYALANSKNGDLFIRKSPSVSIGSIAKLIGNGYTVTGARPGEKKFETMATSAEISASEEIEGRYLRVSLIGQNVPANSRTSVEYNSHNSERMREEDLKKIILDISSSMHIN